MYGTDISDPYRSLSTKFVKQFDSLTDHTVKKVDDPRQEIVSIADASLKVSSLTHVYIILLIYYNVVTTSKYK